MNALRLIYCPEDERHGRVSAVVESEGFRGEGAAWFTIDQLREFCRRAEQYPLVGDEAASLAGGYFDRGGTAPDRCHLGLWLSPHDRLGSIRVTVTLATPFQNCEDADLHQNVTTRFLVSYNDVALFRAALEAMLDGGAEEAVLEAGAPS